MTPAASSTVPASASRAPIIPAVPDAVACVREAVRAHGKYLGVLPREALPPPPRAPTINRQGRLRTDLVVAGQDFQLVPKPGERRACNGN